MRRPETQDVDRTDSQNFQTADPDGSEGQSTIVLIDSQCLFRESLAQALQMHTGLEVTSYSSIGEWQSSEPRGMPLVLLLGIGSRKLHQDIGRGVIEQFVRAAGTVPVIVVSDIEDAEQILEVFEIGARGYISTAESLRVASEAINLVRVGGFYFPAARFLNGRTLKRERTAADCDAPVGTLTARQWDVLNAVREGKANKLIAYELNMKESTVKVHLRNLSKKLQARNRTEIAFKATRMLALDRDPM